MPIFVSRFSPNRVVGANLRQVRSQAPQPNERASNTTQRDQQQSDRTQGSNDTRRSERAREALLARTTQLAQRIAERLQATRATQANNTQQTTTQTSTTQTSTTTPQQQTTDTTRTTNTAQNNRSNALEARLQTPPGVGATRTASDNDTERPGRLSRAPANPFQEQQLNRFARLRAIASGIIQQNNNTARPTLPENAVVNQTEARTRFLASNRSQGIGVGQQITRGQTNEPSPLQTATIAQTATPLQQAVTTTPVSRPETPTAEEISRANTTPEIRNNLQQDTREVAQGLTRDATRELQQTTQQTAQNAERAAANRREETRTESREDIRELQTEQRQLERELQQTQQQLRQERLQVQRAQSATSNSTTSSAVAIGSNINILAD